MSKIRLLHVLVQPVIVIEDDNGEFEPGPTVTPRPMKASQLAALSGALDEQIAELQRELDKPSA